MLSVLSHVAAVLPTPSKKYCKKIETIITNFIRGENAPTTPNENAKLKASIVSQEVIFAPKTHNGLGLQRVATFWSAIKMGWFRRLDHESFWRTLHIEDLADKTLIFNPHSSNETLLKKALTHMKKSNDEGNIHLTTKMQKKCHPNRTHFSTFPSSLWRRKNHKEKPPCLLRMGHGSESNRYYNI